MVTIEDPELQKLLREVGLQEAAVAHCRVALKKEKEGLRRAQQAVKKRTKELKAQRRARGRRPTL